MKNPEVFDQIDQEDIIRDNPHEFIMQHRDKIIDMLGSAEVKTLGNLDDIDEISAHSNKVFLTELNIGDELKKGISSSNAIRFFEYNYGPGKLHAIFKPKNGEDPSRLRTFGIDPKQGLFVRERAAYLVDEYAGLGIVLPTVIKTIDGEIGSLQLYIPHTVAEDARRTGQDLKQDVLFGGSQWKKMALLDRLIDNADRSDENYLVCHDNSQIFAIDHGFSFCLVPDPSKEINRAYQYFLQSPDLAQLDDELRECLENLLKHEAEIEAEIQGDESIEDPELIARGLLTTRTFDRARKMLEANSICV